MPRRMSCSLTVDAVRARTKTVTRRRADTWVDLEPGDRLTLIEKGMGLPKGARQVVLAEVVVVNVTDEWLAQITRSEIRREGFDPDVMSCDEFATMWCAGHGYSNANPSTLPVRRIEWRYLDEVPS